jgi:hypothetical protein
MEVPGCSFPTSSCGRCWGSLHPGCPTFFPHAPCTYVHRLYLPRHGSLWLPCPDQQLWRMLESSLSGLPSFPHAPCTHVHKLYLPKHGSPWLQCPDLQLWRMLGSSSSGLPSFSILSYMLPVHMFLHFIYVGMEVSGCRVPASSCGGCWGPLHRGCPPSRPPFPLYKCS